MKHRFARKAAPLILAVGLTVSPLSEKIVQAKDELQNKYVEGSSGGGMVRVRMNGEFEIDDISIEEEILKGDNAMLKDLIIAAFNDAISKVRDLIAQDMKGITGGFNIPGLF